ncbi:MAG TPA: tetratricopeptide repeat protein [Phycisphaerae bacterium]|nr:tetratricopeptide repeat protein [Phycisphaerae bacterium]
MKASRRNRHAREKSGGGPRTDEPQTHRGATAWLSVAIAAIVFIAFLPCLSNDFNYDDEKNILENRDFRGLGISNLRWMFTTFHMGHYQPLSWVTLGLDYVIWGKNPRGYHLTNLLLHAANAVLVLLIARRLLNLGMGNAIRRSAVDAGAFIAALLFAVHPLRVESVAWVTERRDVLSSFFLLATVLLYFRANEAAGQSRRKLLAAAVAAFLLSLLSRAMGVTLPLILLVLDVYPLQRLGGGRGYVNRAVRGVWLEKIPFIALAAAAAILAPIAQKDVGAAIELSRHGMDGRIAQAAYGLVFYIYKSLLPLNLSPIYELRLPLNVLAAKYIVSAIVLLGLTATVALLRRRFPALAAVALCHVIFLLPVLGFAQSGPQEVADRYSYLPAIGWSILIGGIAAFVWTRPIHNVRPVVGVASTVIVVTLCVLTWRQCLVWRSALTLWTHATRNGPPAASAHYNLACALAKSGDKQAAIGEFHKAIDVNPVFASAHYNLSNTLYETGRVEDAILGYRRVLELDRHFGRAHYELGRVFGEQRRYQQAKEEYRAAIRVAPSLVKAYINLGVIVAQQDKDHAAAMDLYRQALAIRPNHRDALYNMAISLDAVGRTDEAVSYYRDTIRADASFPDARINLGNILARRGQTTEALAEYQAALRIAPNHPVARANYEGLSRQQSK